MTIDTDIVRFAEDCIRLFDPSITITWRQERMPSRGDGKYTWDGKGSLRMSEVDPLHAIHDVAHVLVCPKRRLVLPEFGLGPDPSNVNTEAPMVISWGRTKAEEEKACTVHWAFGAYLGGVHTATRVKTYLNIQELPDLLRIDKLCTHKCLPGDFVRKVKQVRCLSYE